ncbi:alpha/beta hydrolase [Fibrella sp. WM1]|uniref:alpha/beta hydrolase n=1 Tax=Fibrella musci TaxID=3242485 RepID=UPI0035201E32
MKRILLILIGLLTGLALVYALGPRYRFDAVKREAVKLAETANPSDLARLERLIAESERQAGLKPDNEARIVWADSARKQKTPYSIVYIPGFGASWAEGDPVHTQLARRFGCNLYLARPAEHGLRSPDAMRDLTPARYVASAERALAIGQALGDRVILVGTSAGGMLSLCLAAEHPELAAVVLYSPCIEVANPALALTTGPWGQQILNTVMPDEHVTVTHYKPDRARYWLTRYHTNGLLTLQTMLDTYMTPELFARVKQPLFMGYYYKDEANQDKTVSVAAMRAMFDQLGTLPNQKQQVAFPKAGEHVIASHFTSGDLDGVYRATEQFLREKVGLKPTE